MEQRIAPNNQLPAAHFIEVWKAKKDTVHEELSPRKCIFIEDIDMVLEHTELKENLHTYAIFRIRENKLPTKHKF